MIGNCYLTRRDRGKENSGTGKSRTTRHEQRGGYEPLSLRSVSRGLIARRESRKPTRLRSSLLPLPSPRSPQVRHIDIRPRTRSAHTTRYCNVRETGLCMCTLPAFPLVRATRRPIERCIFEMRERRSKVEAINPPSRARARAGLFRKAKDDKGQSARE